MYIPKNQGMQMDFISHKEMCRGGGDSPFFSIIVLSYNKELFIEKCIKSCINQTFQNIEIIIVDDCSQDKTVELINNYRDFKQLSIIQNSTNSGAFASRIIGEQHAKGEYIIHVDGDDFVKTTMCEILHPYCKTHQWDIIGFGWTNIGLDGKHTNMHHTNGKSTVNKVIMELGITTLAIRNSILKQTHNFIYSKLFKKIPNLSNLEDGVHSFAIAVFAQKYLGINECLYFRQNNLQSTTGDCTNIKKNHKKLQDIKTSILLITKIVQYLQLQPEEQKYLKQNIKTIFNPIADQYQYIYYHSKAYEKKLFAYPVNFLKSLWYTKYLNIAFKTLIRIWIYFITFGKVKL